jgi:hypothetical protein
LTLLNFTANFEKLIAFAIESELSSTQSKLFGPHFTPPAKKNKYPVPTIVKPEDLRNKKIEIINLQNMLRILGRCLNFVQRSRLGEVRE